MPGEVEEMGVEEVRAIGHPRIRPLPVSWLVLTTYCFVIRLSPAHNVRLGGADVDALVQLAGAARHGATYRRSTCPAPETPAA